MKRGSATTPEQTGGDTSLSGNRVACELTTLIGLRGKPHMVVCDNGTELTSLAILRWSQERQVDGIISRRGSRCRTASSRASMVACATNASTRPCSRRWRMPASCSWLGNTFIITSGHTRNWAGKPPPRSPANGPGVMPPGPLPSHQPTIMKEPDSTSDW